MSKQGKTNYVTQQQLKTIRGGKGIGHIHSNKDALDTITEETLEAWDEVVAMAHSHSNKNALDLLRYDPETNILFIGTAGNPISFAAFGEITAHGVGSDTPTPSATTLGGLLNVVDSADDVQDEDVLLVRRKNASGASSWTLASLSSIGGGNVDDVKVNGTSVVTNKVANIALTWANVQDKPSWIGDSKPSYAFSDITGTLAASQVPTLAISKISGLQDALNGKADADDIPTALSELSADSTHRLVTDSQITAWNGKWGTPTNASVLLGITAAQMTKLDGIASGAQVNVLEAVKLNGTALSITDKAVNVLAATSLGVPTGFSAGALTNGKITISFASGYSLPSNAMMTDWDNKYDLPSGGIPLDDLASGVQNSLDNADTAYGWGDWRTRVGTLEGYFTSGSAKKAVQLTNTRTLWGQNFNGTANVSGDMSSVGKITFSSQSSKATSGNVLEVVNIGTSSNPVYALHTTLPFFSDSEITAHGVGSGGGGSSDVTLTDNYNNTYTLAVGQTTATALTTKAYVDAAVAGHISAVTLSLGGISKTGSSLSFTGAELATAIGNNAVAKATDADTLDGQHGSYYATASSLGNYVAKSGDTITGGITMDGETSEVPFIRNFTYSSSSGWTRNAASIQVDGVSKFAIGAYGSYTAGASDNGINYAYLGCNAYNGLNLRISATELKWGDNAIYHAGNLTKSTLGLGNVENKSSATIRGELTAANVTTALGSTYVQNANYATNAGTVGGYSPSSQIMLWSSSLSSSADCDELVNAGCYRFGSTAGHMPTDGSYGNMLTVRGRSGADTLFQLFGNYSSDRLWFRSGTWNTSSGSIRGKAWKEIYHSGNLTAATLGALTTTAAAATYLPLSGGTMTGALTMKNDSNSPYIMFSRGTSNPAYLYYLGGTRWNVTNEGWGAAYSLYHSGNSNNTSTPWSASTINVSDSAHYTGLVSVYGDGYFKATLSGAGITIDSPTYTGGWNGGLFISEQGNRVGSAISWFASSLGVGYIRIGNFGSTLDNPAMYINSNGNVGIGTTSPSEKLHVAGNIVATGEVAAHSSSDLRFKKNIRGYDNAIGKIMSLRPVTFDWNGLATSLNSANTGHSFGLIAQEVQSVIPEVVRPMYEKYWGIDYGKLTTLCIAGIQNHETRIQQLERENKELKRQLQQLNINS